MLPSHRLLIVCAMCACVGAGACELGGVIGVDSVAGSSPGDSGAVDGGSSRDDKSPELPPADPEPVAPEPYVPTAPEVADGGNPADTPDAGGESVGDAGGGVVDSATPVVDGGAGQCVNDVLESPCWFDAAWSFRNKLTIDGSLVPGSLTAFPVVLSGVRNAWRGTGSGGQVARADGGDFVFTANDATTPLDHEIEQYDAATGQLVAWVKVPVLASPNDTVLYLYYGSAAASDQARPQQVWDDGGSNAFRGVWHMSESGTSDRRDSTAFGNHCSPQDYDGDEGATGQVGGADNLDGKDDWLTCGSHRSLEVDTGLTVSYWVQQTLPGLDKEEWYNGPWKGGYAPYLYSEDGSTTVLAAYLEIDGKDQDRFNVSTTDIPEESWAHLAVTFDGTNLRGYVNGQLDFTVEHAGAITSTESIPLTIGEKEGKDGLEMRGLLDEIRVSNVPRGDDWIATSYANQNDPAAFIRVGDEVQRPD